MGAGQPGPRKVGIVLHLPREQPWGEIVRRDLQEALSAPPEFTVEFVHAPDPDDQAKVLERLLAMGVAGLILAPLEEARLAGQLRRYRAAGVPVVIIDSELTDPALYDAAVLVDNELIGRLAAKFFVETMKGRGDLVEIHGERHTRTARLRSAGFRSVLAGQPQLRVVAEVEAGWLAPAAERAFGEVLARRKRIDGVFAHNDAMALGAVEAATRARRADEMLVTGVDAVPGERGTIKLVTHGLLAATFLNPSPGRAAASILRSILNGEPHLKRTLLKTSPLRSKQRLHAWQATQGARRQG